MMNSEIRQRLILLCTFSAPIALVYCGYAFLNHSGPQVADAIPATAGQSSPAARAGSSINTLTRQQRAAMGHLDKLGSLQLEQSPFFYILPDQPDDNDPVPVPDMPVAERDPEFDIQVIMVTSTGNIALINGVPHREGHTVAGSNWVITSIDGTALSVTIQSRETGRKVTKYVERNG